MSSYNRARLMPRTSSASADKLMNSRSNDGFGVGIGSFPSAFEASVGTRAPLGLFAADMPPATLGKNASLLRLFDQPFADQKRLNGAFKGLARKSDLGGNDIHPQLALSFPQGAEVL